MINFILLNIGLKAEADHAAKELEEKMKTTENGGRGKNKHQLSFHVL